MMNAVVQREGVLIPVFLLGLGVVLLSRRIEFYQRHMHPVQAAIIYAFEPVATLFGLGLGLVEWTWWIPFGGGILLIGNILVEITSPTEESSEPVEAMP